MGECVSNAAELDGNLDTAGWQTFELLKKLPDETLLYPGHLYSSEPESTLGEQKRTNPYLRVSGLDTFLGFLGLLFRLLTRGRRALRGRAGLEFYYDGRR